MPQISEDYAKPRSVDLFCILSAHNTFILLASLK